MKKSYILIFLTVAFISLAAVGDYLIIQQSQIFNKNKAKYAEVMNFENRLKELSIAVLKDMGTSALSALKDKLLLRDTDDTVKLDYRKKAEAEEALMLAEEAQANATQWALMLAGLCILYLISIFIFISDKVFFYRSMALAFLVVSALCLVVGIFAPMLEISAFKNEINFDLDIPLLAKKYELAVDMYFYYQNKSVLDLLALLFSKGNYVVGMFILMFSIVMPLTKLIASIVSIWNKGGKMSKFQYFLVHKIGKWSMADVFVAATFLAYLSFNNMNAGISTESNTLVGMYFFMAFVVLSISASYFIDLAYKQIKSGE